MQEVIGMSKGLYIGPMGLADSLAGFARLGLLFLGGI